MSKFNFFDKALVATTDFADHRRTWSFNSSGIMILNESTAAGDVVQYSFDGVTVHGDTVPGSPSAGVSFDNRIESGVWLRLESAGSAVIVRIESWGF